MKTFVFKLYNSKKNKKLHQVINVSGCIYNHCIALHKRYYKIYKKKINLYKLQKHIAKLKKLKKYEFWNQVGSQAIQDIVERIEKSYKQFFKNRKKKVKTSLPNFRKIRKYKSFTLKQAGYKIEDNNITILKNDYKFIKSREIEGKIKTVTVKRDSLGDIYIHVTCECERKEVQTRTGEIVGLDFGLKTFLVSSDGFKIESPLFFKQNLTKIKKANRNLSRKKKKSNNEKRAGIELARIHKKTANKRKDFHYKLSNSLCEKYAVICVENLDIASMQKQWGRKISDLGHSQFITILKNQSYKFDSVIIEIPRFYPSSKTCNECGYVFNGLTLTVRAWECPNCKAKHDRDFNASKNIVQVGTSTYMNRLNNT